MKAHLDGEAYELHNNMLIAADMIANLADRHLVYAVMKAAKVATLTGANPRKVFVSQSHKFPHIELDMNFMNWKDDDDRE